VWLWPDAVSCQPDDETDQPSSYHRCRTTRRYTLSDDFPAGPKCRSDAIKDESRLLSLRQSRNLCSKKAQIYLHEQTERKEKKLTELFLFLLATIAYNKLLRNNAYRVIQNKVASLKLLTIFSPRLSLFVWNFANLLAIYIHTYLPILVDLS